MNRNIIGIDIGGTKCADKTSAIGISCGGPLDSKKGMILSPPNLPGWDRIPIVEIIEKRLGVKTAVQNELTGLTAKTVAEAAEAGDPLAREIYRECAHYHRPRRIRRKHRRLRRPISRSKRINFIIHNS